MKVESFVNNLGAEFFTGVPDSLLKPLCDYLMNTIGISKKHIIAANEGNCAALAAGYHMATGNVPVVYMQNSGIGNIINPAASLLHDKVYAIPCIFVVGWRGEPGTHDEPQHVYQGEVTLKLLEDMNIRTCVISENITEVQMREIMEDFQIILAEGKSVAFVIQKGALTYDGKIRYQNDHTLYREEIIRHIVQVSGEDPIISTTGKASRELFEIREDNGQGHQYDFLTVGSMGHSSSIALGIALNRPKQKIWCIDGDGASLMHMGAMAVIGQNAPGNLVHVMINNGAHETVGGMPTAAGGLDFIQIARGCGYPYVVSAANLKELDVALKEAKVRNGLTYIEVKSAIGARQDLGRPTTTAVENKKGFMEQLTSADR